MSNEPSKADLAVAHYTRRKCSDIVEKTLAAFLTASAQWGSLSLDERFGIALTLTMAIAVEPWEKASTDPVKIRKELGRQFRHYIELGPDGGE